MRTPLQMPLHCTQDPPETPSSPTDHQDHHQDLHHLEGFSSKEEGRKASHLKRWRPRSSKAQQQQHFVIGRSHSLSDSHWPPPAPARPLQLREAPEEESLATRSSPPQVHRQGERRGAASKSKCLHFLALFLFAIFPYSLSAPSLLAQRSTLPHGALALACHWAPGLRP